MSKKIEAQDISGQGSVHLYAARENIHPKSINGRFERLRNITVWLTMGLYLALPWVQWEGRQAVLFDLPGRQFHVFGFTFWPQDFIYLSWALIIAAFGLFFVTVFAGRVYCGYVCPQTTWTKFFTWIEEKLEGDRNARIKLDAAPWGARKLVLRSSKHVLWLLLAGLTGLTFVGYFSTIPDLTYRVATFDLNGWETFWILFFTGATYMNAGWMREQVCKYMCPYARFQSVMFDADTSATMKSVASRATAAPRVATRKTVATVSTAACACRSARPASISVKACSMNALPVQPVSMPATSSWIASTSRVA